MVNTRSSLQFTFLSSTRLWAALILSGAMVGMAVPKVTAAEKSASVIDATTAALEASPVSTPVQLAGLPSEDTPSSMDTVNWVGELHQGSDQQSSLGLDQVTSVSQLTDVKPTDWAFQALQSLVERYGCIVGYPDKTYRGNRALTRFEFAAGLNACLDKIQELIAAATADFVKKEDLEVVKKLQEEFAAELAALRGRVDALEVRTATLEKQQFSTTTKLRGLTWFNLTNATTFDKNLRFEAIPNLGGSTPSATQPIGIRLAGRDAITGNPLVQQTSKASTTASFLTWLTFDTSFTGKDSLVVQLAAGNGISPVNEFASAGFFNSFGAPFTDQSGGTVNGRSDVVIHDLFYTFPLGDKIKVTVGPRVNWYRYFDFNRYTFFLNGASSFDSIGSTQSNAIDRGSGAVIEFNISPKLRFVASYLGENTEFLPQGNGLNTSSDPAFGLFGGTYTATAELTFSPSSNFNLRLMYNYSRLQAVFGQVGGAVGEPIPYGYLDAGPGFSSYNAATGFAGDGGLKFASANFIGVNFDWAITPAFGIFGRYGYGDISLKPIDRNVTVQSFQVGLGFPDLFKKGTLGVVTFLMPMDITSGRRFFAAGGGDGGTMYELEASYYYPVSDNISIVPAFYAIFNANNFNSNPTVYVFNLRTQFSF